MAATTYAMNKVLNANFGGQTGLQAIPATLYFGLATTDITEDGWTGMTEVVPVVTGPTGTNYDRVAYPNTTSGWSTATGAMVLNQTGVIFPQSSYAWGTVKTLFLIDAAGPTGPGNILWYTSLTPELIVPADLVITYAANTIQVTMGNTGV